MGKKKGSQALCPCGSAMTYENCCEVFHLGVAAPTPLALMRSRYTAYVLGMEPYLLATWHSSTRPEKLDLEGDQMNWMGLEIRQAPLAEGSAGEVEFIARYKIGGRAYRLHELSRFCLEEGRWFYLDGSFPSA